MSLLSEDREPFRLLPMQPDGGDLFSISGSVGPNGENRRDDVIKAQLLLAETGDFDPDGVFKMPTGWPSGFTALSRNCRSVTAKLSTAPCCLSHLAAWMHTVSARRWLH